MRTGGKLYPSQHEAIIDRETWDAVQQKLEDRTQWTGQPRLERSPLAGKIFWNDRRLTPTHTKKRGKIHRYYISDANKPGVTDRFRLNAPALEQAVFDSVKNWLSAPLRTVSSILQHDVDATTVNVIADHIEISHKIVALENSLDSILPFLAQVRLTESQIEITLQPNSIVANPELQENLREEVVFETPLTFKKRGHEVRLIVGGCDSPSMPNETTVSLMAKMWARKNHWFEHPNRKLCDILIQDGYAPTGYSREIRLAFIAPDIVDAFLSGDAPIQITAEKLKRLSSIPADWDEQRDTLGMSA